MDSDLLEISAFKMNNMSGRSKVTFWGKECNAKFIFKTYRNYFESLGQVTAIMESIPANSMLVIDETNPHARTEDIVSYFHA